jgi:hypothetical protein
VNTLPGEDAVGSDVAFEEWLPWRVQPLAMLLIGKGESYASFKYSSELCSRLRASMDTTVCTFPGEPVFALLQISLGEEIGHVHHLVTPTDSSLAEVQLLKGERRKFPVENALLNMTSGRIEKVIRCLLVLADAIGKERRELNRIARVLQASFALDKEGADSLMSYDASLLDELLGERLSFEVAESRYVRVASNAGGSSSFPKVVTAAKNIADLFRLVRGLLDEYSEEIARQDCPKMKAYRKEANYQGYCVSDAGVPVQLQLGSTSGCRPERAEGETKEATNSWTYISEKTVLSKTLQSPPRRYFLGVELVSCYEALAVDLSEGREMSLESLCGFNILLGLALAMNPHDEKLLDEEISLFRDFVTGVRMRRHVKRAKNQFVPPPELERHFVASAVDFSILVPALLSKYYEKISDTYGAKTTVGDLYRKLDAEPVKALKKWFKSLSEKNHIPVISIRSVGNEVPEMMVAKHDRSLSTVYAVTGSESHAPSIQSYYGADSLHHLEEALENTLRTYLGGEC